MKISTLALMAAISIGISAFGSFPIASAVVLEKSSQTADATLPSTEDFTDRMIVKLRDRRQANAQLSAATVTGLSANAGVSLSLIRPMSGDAHVMGLPQKISVDQAWELAQRLMNDPAVEYAEPDRWVHPQIASPIAEPNDVRYPEQWHYQGAAISPGGANVRAAWNRTTGAAGLTIAVIDTGLRPHEDIASNILNGSGRVVPGYDFISSAASANDGDGRDSDPTDPGDAVAYDECSTGSAAKNSSWHGTHVAGTIGALSNNGTGVTGINWVSKILPVRVLGKCGGATSDIADAMRWAAGLAVAGVPVNANPARVLNLSLGGTGGCGFAYQNAIDAVTAANAVVIVSAGNSNANASNAFPANCNGVIAVGAVGPTGARAYYSNYGAIVKIAAPGGDMANGPSGGVLSTMNAGLTSPGADNYAYYQGTSMAAPHVAGIVSLMLSVNPALTPAQILSLMQLTARPFPTGTIRDCTTSLCGPGIIDAAAAVAASDPVSSGMLQFATNTLKTSEAVSTLAMSVERFAGANGPASVNYTTANGTATAGLDYGTVSGTLTWANGDSSSKTFYIPIIQDGISEPSKTFSVLLSSATGAVLGNINSVAVTMTDADAFPLNGAMPAGWVMPPTANAGWSVTADASSEGMFSLKSGSIADGQTSQIQVTKLFQAGTVTFSRRVSSEANYDFLEFYIDGSRKGGWSGELAWNSVSFPLTAGTHTLRWSYVKDTQCCSVGDDTAWVDAVSLPPEMTPPGAPVIIGIAPGQSRITISFTAPSNGGDPNLLYTVSCSANGQTTRTATGSTSPISVFEMTPGVSYSCSVRASNGAGSGMASASMTAVPAVRSKDLTPVLMLLLN